MENEMENKKKEIDLIDVLKSFFSFLWNTIKQLIKFIGWLTRFIYQGKYIILVFTILGCVWGFYKSREKVYRAEVDIKLNAYDSYFIKSLIEPMADQCKYLDTKTLSDELGISEKNAKSLVNIKSYHFVDYLSNSTPDAVDYKENFDPSDTINTIMRDRLRLTVDSRDTSLFKNLDKAFLYYFNTNPQIRKENLLRDKQLVEQINVIENEIYLLDSLRKKEYFVRKKSMELYYDKTIMINEREMKLYHEDILFLEKNRQQLIWENQIFKEGILFANRFEINPRPINHWTKVVPLFGGVFFIIGLFVALCWNYRKNIFQFLNQKV